VTGSRTPYVLSGLIGGLIAVVLGAVLIATDVIDTGDTTREVVSQAPLTRPASNSDEGLTVTDIYDRDGPGVVFIQSDIRAQRTSPFGLPDQGGGIATGSGFVLDKDGYILTNAHVVEDAREVGVRFTEESDLVEAKVVGADLSSDLAVLKVDPDDAPKLVPLKLGDSADMRVGDPVIAIGNPFGYSRTVTTGIVSALQRQITAPNNFQIDNVIQTDASINPGNSGGPLIDAHGEVIGINSQIATGGASGSVGIGFAIPVNTAKEIVPQLEQDGEVERPYLGVTTTTVTEQVAQDLNLPVDQGALVQEVVPDGPADNAGLRGGRRPGHRAERRRGRCDPRPQPGRHRHDRVLPRRRAQERRRRARQAPAGPRGRRPAAGRRGASGRGPSLPPSVALRRRARRAQARRVPVYVMRP
jgi:S1-C subfamily serine protease